MEKMTLRRFNDLLNGPIYHPMAPFFISRLAGALQHVVWATGEQGARALEEWCKMRDEADQDPSKHTSSQALDKLKG